jgi:hypothetical protein
MATNVGVGHNKHLIVRSTIGLADDRMVKMANIANFG